MEKQFDTAKHRCGDCRFFKQSSSSAAGECRRKPPIFVVAAGTVFPSVSGRLDWCGEGELT